MGTTSGLIKVVSDGRTGKLLGAHLIGPSAGELVHEFTLALYLGASIHDLASMIHVHPTLSEGINAAVGGAHRPAG